MNRLLSLSEDEILFPPLKENMTKELKGAETDNIEKTVTAF